MELVKKRRITSLLGLALDGDRLEVCLLRRTNGTIKVQKNFHVPLALNPLSGDPELVGREIRNHLEQAGIRERHCVVCLPLNWISTQETKVPNLAEEDARSFLQIEAERGFLYGHEALAIEHSRYQLPGGGSYAMLVAIPSNQLLQLDRVLRLAQLRPLSFSLGINALQRPGLESSNGVLALWLGEHRVDLQITCGGGVAALRSLDGVFETEGSQKRLQAERIAREIRITLGQLPAEFRETVRRARFFGAGDYAGRFADEMAPRLEAMGLHFESLSDCAEADVPGVLPAEMSPTPGLVRAAQYLRGLAPAFEFLPPRVSAWQKLTTRVSSKKMFWAGATAAAAAIVVGGLFLFQQWRLTRLQSSWSGMASQAEELEDLQQRIRRFRSWFDEGFGALSIMRKVTEAFPESGVVTAKSLEIRNLSNVMCSGVAQDNQALLEMLDQLRTTHEVGEMKVDQIRGGTPMQFTFNFQWVEGGAHEN